MHATAARLDCDGANGSCAGRVAARTESGAAVTFTELDASSEFYVSAYDTKGNPIADFGGTGISGAMTRGSKFQYRLDWETQKSLWGSTFDGQAAIFEIGAYDYGGTVWQQKFIIDGACS